MRTDVIDWPGLMRLGLGALRMSPAEFWSFSPAEFRYALEGAGLLSTDPKSPMSILQLERLMEKFPDDPSDAVECSE